MDVENIRQRIMAELSDQVEGISGRWTLFTNLFNNADTSQLTIPSMIFAIDSAEENKLGIGRNFVSKKPIGRREMILPQQMAEQLKLLKDDFVTL